LSRCPLCRRTVARTVLAKSSELRPTIAHLVQQDHPGWQPVDGLCPACAAQYAARLIAQRRPDSLHTATEPHTTFPFYHPDEESVLSQRERLPDYATFGGRGVTIAFLDSGYYPHPDLADTAMWPTPSPPWSRLTPAQLQETLEARRLRLAEYVELCEAGELVGRSQPSLWDGAGYSWHGQMTSVLAAGNGALSGGHFRGYAPHAHILPIKIGRSNGRIPEADILAGLQWLLSDERWQRYNVRVVNIAVGGDFEQPWQLNPVCLAAEQLSERGVLICAAAGNSGRNSLLAPAQAPSVLTVGGYEDANRRWNPAEAKALAALELYHHNYGRVRHHGRWLRKPELLALGRWMPAPILPTSPIFAEVYTIGELRQVLLDHRPPFAQHPVEDGLLEEWMFEVWEAVRKRMNAHKWIHPYYQHVDGTSVAVTQVSAVAAQMGEANPALSGQAIKRILLDTALALPDKPAHVTGHGILQPTRAVAAAARAGNGPLTGLPHSGATPTPGELQNWLRQGKVADEDFLNPAGDGSLRPVYFGFFAPDAQAVSLVAPFNHWQPGQLKLNPAQRGWWHGIIHLSPGAHCYRFWIESERMPVPRWQPDPEHPHRVEGGYVDDHSVVYV
jgi:serine protease AprX